MDVKRTVVDAIVGQFSCPSGIVGNLAGWQMAHRPSNRKRNSWVVALLDVRPGERALEIGFGPGLSIADLSSRVGPSGHVHGIDRSDVMLRHATRRNAAAIAEGRVTLTRAPVEELPPALDGPFDVMLSVNSFAFWTDPGRRLEDLRRRLAPGGRIAIASQPRHPRASKDPAVISRERTALLSDAGFTSVRTEVLDLAPPVVCVVASR